MSSSHNIRLTGELSTPTSSSFYTFLYVFHFSGFYLSIFLELLPTCFIFSWLKDTFLVPDTLPDFRLIIKLYSRLSPGQSGLLDHIFAHLALALEPLEIGIELRNKYCQQTRLDAEWKRKRLKAPIERDVCLVRSRRDHTTRTYDCTYRLFAILIAFRVKWRPI